jgi:PAT family beta-lactamase induction signal transducer AmpG
MQAEKTDTPDSKAGWLSYIPYLWKPQVFRMIFLGFSAGLPLFLIFSSLSLWLREAGIDRSAVTYFSWAALGYSFKFLWAPLVGRMPLPLLTEIFGQRRSWLLLSQCAIILSIIMMAMTDPVSSQHALTIMAIAAVALGFSSATQDVVIDAYRIESAENKYQALMSSMYITGYRFGMLASGAGALYLASYFGSSSDVYSYQAWQSTYLLMALCMGIGVATTLLIPEPDNSKANATEHSFHYREHLTLLATFLLAIIGIIGCYVITSEPAESIKVLLQQLSHNQALSSTLTEATRLGIALSLAYLIAKSLTSAGFVNKHLVDDFYVTPVKDFFSRYSTKQVILLLSLISLYRISDIVLGVISNVFYQDIGFSKAEIATVVKTFGLIMSLLGGLLGGLMAIRMGVITTLFLGALLSAITNLLFVLLASTAPTIEMLYIVIAADNLAAGVATAAFVAFLSSLVNLSFTAMQYAIFSSVMTLFPKLLGGYSGTIVDSIGYAPFFVMTFVLGLPVLVIIMALSLDKSFKTERNQHPENQ